MKYAIYKLNFLTGVHIGTGRLSKSSMAFLADTIFSALCQEALKMNGETGIERLVDYVKKGKLLISDSMPYIGEEYYLPKPVVSNINGDKKDSSVKKQIKKLTYVSEKHYQDFLAGELDIKSEWEGLSMLGKKETRTRVNNRDDSGPYQIGVFHYENNLTGLYIIVAYADDEILDMVEELLYSLGYEGIGGKVSTGLGKFEPIYADVPETLQERLEKFSAYPYKVVLSVSLPRENELEQALMDADYSIVARSGFVASQMYAEKFQKKKELYCLKAGSCVRNIYEGNVYDVSAGGRHAVYRYAKPMFMGVEM